MTTSVAMLLLQGTPLRFMFRSLSSAAPRWHQQLLKAPQAGAPVPSNLSPRQRRIIYRSKQRGWLELDILFGAWAAEHVPHITDEPTIQQIEHLLDADTPYVLKWILGQQPAPPEYQTPVLDSLRAYATGDSDVNHKQA